jgi:plastocyanin
MPATPARSLPDIDLSTVANDPRPSASFSAPKNPQCIPARTPPVFPSLRPCIWPHLLRLVTNTNVGQAPSALPTEVEVESITVEIRGRAFTPNRVILRTGQKTALRFRNHDTELHAVVAKELFLGVSLNVDGNGAPEFGPNGLKRVIIPPEGIIEIQFTPARTGTFSYLCDMPGHDMQAVIVVE